MPRMSLDDFARHLGRCSTQMPRETRDGLRQSGVLIQAAARSYIGEYQEAVGPFPAWKPLAESTLHGGVSPTGYRYKGKIELGYSPPDNPLLREGDLRSSIKRHVADTELTVFSTSKIAGYQEFGTHDTPQHNAIPPRAFIGRAMAQHGQAQAGLVCRTALRPLLTGRV